MTVLNESQEEQLKEITANLRHIRQEKSIRLEEVAMHTHIRLGFLQALDEWRFEELPEPVFVQGFIRRYADKLGLDGMALAKRFEINLFPPASNNSTLPSPLYIPLFVPYIFLLIAASGGLFYLLKSEFTGKSLAYRQNPILSVQQKTVQSPVSQVVSTPSPSQTNTPISTPSPSPTNTPISDVVVSLELKGKSWVQVKADGKTDFEGTLSKGERKTWTAKNALTVRSGNAGVVLVSVNDQELQLLGNAGEVKEVTYNSQKSEVSSQRQRKNN
ncbi:helix-turn-helix domain-containing protein [Anabaena sphaerica FACHB-251]|uniref:Helix-turn-helix domain-containing protein n=1 Tax=Anabaena sphaerica FACHB-251 TaxID=2692883 RepID=A0A927A069_9NOST|nr:helix-turn-helix domain-containing protein [Anabaena sphaerica FACHB-251]